MSLLSFLSILRPSDIEFIETLDTSDALLQTLSLLFRPLTSPTVELFWRLVLFVVITLPIKFLMLSMMNKKNFVELKYIVFFIYIVNVCWCWSIHNRTLIVWKMFAPLIFDWRGQILNCFRCQLEINKR